MNLAYFWHKHTVSVVFETICNGIMGISNLCVCAMSKPLWGLSPCGEGGLSLISHW